MSGFLSDGGYDQGRRVFELKPARHHKPLLAAM